MNKIRPFFGLKKPDRFEPPVQRLDLNIFRLMPGDVIMTKGIYNMIIDAIKDIPDLPKDQQRIKCDLIIEQLRSFLGD